MAKRLKRVRATNTDLGNARRLVALFGKDIRHCPEHKQWLIWNGQHWEWDRDGKINRFAKEVARVMYADAAGINDADRRKELAAWAMKSQSAYQIDMMIKVAQTEPGIPVRASALDADSALFAATSGACPDTLFPERVNRGGAF